ncbi:MAG: hypothetical protein IKE63_04245 [Bacilli bacterium]|nr:hypothetical protein [Bacilli bacterium]
MESKKKVGNKKSTGVRRTTKSSVAPKRTVKKKVAVKGPTTVKKTVKKKESVKVPSKSVRNVRNQAAVKTKRTINVKRIIILLIVIILIIFALIKIVSKPDKKVTDKLVYNKNESFIKSQKIDGIVFKNINCSYDGKNSLISYTIVNETKKKINLSNYDVFVKDKKKVIITKIVANVQQELEPKKGVDMANSVVGVDLTDAYYLELKLKIDDVKDKKS